MKLFRTYFIGVLFFLSAFWAYGKSASSEGERMLPTHSEAAIILAKYSGMFDRYVGHDATMSECVNFLNKNGIYFGLTEVVQGASFAEDDCARVMGQIELVFSGEALYQSGKVILPKGIDSWVSFCIMNNVNYRQGYQNIVLAVESLRQMGD